MSALFTAVSRRQSGKLRAHEREERSRRGELMAKHPKTEDAAGSHQGQTLFRNLLSLTLFSNVQGLREQLEAENDKHLLAPSGES